MRSRISIALFLLSCCPGCAQESDQHQLIISADETSDATTVVLREAPVNSIIDSFGVHEVQVPFAVTNPDPIHTMSLSVHRRSCSCARVTLESATIPAGESVRAVVTIRIAGCGSFCLRGIGD